MCQAGDKSLHHRFAGRTFASPEVASISATFCLRSLSVVRVRDNGRTSCASWFVEENVPQPLRIRLFVADSSPISAQLLAEALAKDSGIDLLGFSSDPLEVVR